MKDTFTMLLTLVIMVIGLAIIVGGPGAARFLFAPFIAGLRHMVRAVFVALIVLILLAAMLSGKKSRPTGGQHAGTTAESAAEDVSGLGSGGEVRDAH